jgi:site-specific recombinase XerD
MNKKKKPQRHAESAPAPDMLPPFITDLLRKYEQSLKALGRSPKTTPWYLEILTRYFFFLQGKNLLSPVEKMGRQELKEYLLHLQSCQRWPKRPPSRDGTNRLSPFTVQGHARAIKAFWGWMFREEYIEKNPLDKFPLPSVPKNVIKIIEFEQFEKLLSVIDRSTPKGAQRNCMMLLLYDGGPRIGELVNSRIENIDFSVGLIKVLGKRNKEREIPISRPAIREIRRYLRDFRPKICPVESPYLFPKPDGTPISINSIQQFLRRLAKKTGLNDLKLHPHLFRHSFGTQFIVNGGNVFYLKEIMGHESLSTTLKYTHLKPKDLCREHAKFSPVANLGMVKKSDGKQSSAKKIRRQGNVQKETGEAAGRQFSK